MGWRPNGIKELYKETFISLLYNIVEQKENLFSLKSYILIYIKIWIGQ